MAQVVGAPPNAEGCRLNSLPGRAHTQVPVRPPSVRPGRERGRGRRGRGGGGEGSDLQCLPLSLPSSLSQYTCPQLRPGRQEARRAEGGVCLQKKWNFRRHFQHVQ